MATVGSDAPVMVLKSVFLKYDKVCILTSYLIKLNECQRIFITNIFVNCI
jgi:hypothetical protein